MTHRRKLLLALASLALLVALGLGWWLGLRRPIRPEPPARGAHAALPEVPVSTVVVPIVIDLDALEVSMNRSVPQTFIEERGRELERGLLLDAEVSRTGPLQLSVAGGALITKVPVRTRLAVTAPHLKRPIAVDADLELTARTELHLDAGWHLRSQTTLSYTWTSPPVLELGRLEIPVQKRLDARLAEQLPVAAAQLDRDLAARDPVRARVEQIWEDVHEPVPLRGPVPAWLRVEPERIVAGDLALQRDGVHIDAGLTGRFTLVVGDRPEPAPEAPLPDRVAPAPDAALSLRVPVTLPWDAVSAAISRQIAGRTERISVPGTDEPLALTITEASLYPSGASLVLVLRYQLDGPSTPLDGLGELYLSGVPVLDEAAQELRLRDLAAAVATDQAAVDAVAWLLESGALAELESRAHLSLVEPLDRARERIANALGAADGERAALGGELSALSLSAVVPTDEGLVLELTASGRAEVAVSELPRRATALRKPRGLNLRGR